MKLQTAVTLFMLTLVIGCEQSATPKPTTAQPTTTPPTTASPETSGPPSITPEAAMENAAPAAKMPEEKAAASATTDSVPAASATARKPVPVVEGTAELNPENSKIRFVGTHAGEKPDPRTGGFSKFSGKLSVDNGALKELTFEIATGSLWTEIGGKLTTHLKSPDFLDTAEYPEIKFQSTQLASQDDGKVAIAGELTMHGVTKSITIPASVSLGEDGVTLTADFTIDRTDFGMTVAVDKVEKPVSLSVTVGEANEPKAGAAGE